MEASVRYIPMETAVVDGQTFQVGEKPALCFRGKDYAIGIINDQEGIIPVTLTLRDHDTSRMVMYGTEEYPVGKFISHLERIMQEKPISNEALKLILQWPNNPEDFNSGPTVEPQPVKTKTKKTPGQKTLIAVISEEMGVAATKIRKFLRKNGFHAPYEDEQKIRHALKSFK